MDSFKKFILSLLVVILLAGWAWSYYNKTRPRSRTESTTLASSDMNLKDLEKRVHLRVNGERKRRDRKFLTWNKDLGDLARTHSEDMAGNHFFAHINQRGLSPSQRAEFAGFRCPRNPHIRRQLDGVGENIFSSSLYESYEVRYVNSEEQKTYHWKSIEGLAKEIVDQWMGSAGHRKNLLNKAYHLHGIGIVVDEDYVVFVTQDFC